MAFSYHWYRVTRFPNMLIRSGTFTSFVFRFCALRAKNEIQINGEYPAAAGRAALKQTTA
jgi:hypothetical protein